MLHTLQNDYWQVGILPRTGASIAFARVRHGDGWRDVLRPTAEDDYSSASKCASFIMLPWCNRIRGGVLYFEGNTYQLENAPEDGTARHGDVRNRVWQVDESDAAHIRMSFDSAQHERVNFPFRFSAVAEYRLHGQDFVWRLALKNEDTRTMPGGFGHHPYFVRSEDIQLQIPCDAEFELVDYMATAPPVPVPPRLDFRRLRPLEGEGYNHLLTHRHEGAPVRIHYPELNLELSMAADPLFKHILVYTPPGEMTVAVEPMTNASDGFNLYERGIPDSGVFTLLPGEQVSGEIVLSRAD